MRIKKSKGNGNNKVYLSDSELNTMTVAMANLSIIDVEDDSKEFGFDAKDTVEPLKMFDELSKATGLYGELGKDKVVE